MTTLYNVNCIAVIYQKVIKCLRYRNCTGNIRVRQKLMTCFSNFSFRGRGEHEGSYSNQYELEQQNCSKALGSPNSTSANEPKTASGLFSVFYGYVLVVLKCSSL